MQIQSRQRVGSDSPAQSLQQLSLPHLRFGGEPAHQAREDAAPAVAWGLPGALAAPLLPAAEEPPRERPRLVITVRRTPGGCGQGQRAILREVGPGASRLGT